MLLHAVIPSRAGSDNNARRRATIRYNMGKALNPALDSLCYYFLVSHPPPQNPQAVAALEAENATHGDIFYVPLDSTKAYAETIYERDMVKKVWHEMAGLAAGVRAAGFQPAYWAKFDDDVIVLWDRFFPVLRRDMPAEQLVWCAQGTGDFAQAGGYSGMYCNGPYLLSTDVVLKIAADPLQCCTDKEPIHADFEWHYNDGERGCWGCGAVCALSRLFSHAHTDTAPPPQPPPETQTTLSFAGTLTMGALCTLGRTRGGTRMTWASTPRARASPGR